MNQGSRQIPVRVTTARKSKLPTKRNDPSPTRPVSSEQAPCKAKSAIPTAKRQIPVGIVKTLRTNVAYPPQSARANDSVRTVYPAARSGERQEPEGMPEELQAMLAQPLTPGAQRRYETSTTTVKTNDGIKQRTERQITVTNTLKSPQQQQKQQHTQNPKQSKPMSPMKQFDTAVTAELKRQRGDDALQVNPVVASNITSLSESPISKGVDKATSHNLSIASSKSWLQQDRNLTIQSQVDDSALSEAVGKLVQAEAVCRFDGAVRAAELAAEAAPPELAEEAACAGARGYQATLVDTIQERLPGLKPIEVLGYIGITRPR